MQLVSILYLYYAFLRYAYLHYAFSRYAYLSYAFSRYAYFHFCACPSQNAFKRDASGKKGKFAMLHILMDLVHGEGPWTRWFLGWISARLALIWSKMHLQHGSLPFLPLASRFTTF